MLKTNDINITNSESNLYEVIINYKILIEYAVYYETTFIMNWYDNFFIFKEQYYIIISRK